LNTFSSSRNDISILTDSDSDLLHYRLPDLWMSTTGSFSKRKRTYFITLISLQPEVGRYLHSSAKLSWTFHSYGFPWSTRSCIQLYK